MSRESRRLLDSMVASLEDCEEQGLSVGAKDEVEAVLACAKRIHGYKYLELSTRAMALAKLYMMDSMVNLPEARRHLGIAASRGNAEASRMRCLTLALTLALTSPKPMPTPIALALVYPGAELACGHAPPRRRGAKRHC